MSITYTQETKNEVRHNVIRRAVEALTTFRSDACCVRRSYVRDMYEYFLQLHETHEQEEARKIDIDYIREWEHIHSNSIGVKRPEELTVCYLSGPEPENDFKEFIAMGVKPQNIWAFESDRNTYLQALESVYGSDYMQPKLIKTNIERFFENTPKTFDIVYVDACASLISDKHALQCVAALFKYHRLNSPGILISNFASIDENNALDKKAYVETISLYNFIKSNTSSVLTQDKDGYCFSDTYKHELSQVETDLQSCYGDFITSMICNSASIAVPTVRFCNSSYLDSLSSAHPITRHQYTLAEINGIKNNTLYKFFASSCFIKQNNINFSATPKIGKLASEIIASQQGLDLLTCMRKLFNLKDRGVDINENLNTILSFFENNPLMFQFLDKPNQTLFFDSVINQLSHPMHYASDKAMRLTYIAKQKRMFTDLHLFDECRYIYDWLPAIHQIQHAFSNPSWQYTYRFALDGLIKQRIKYNNEFFFQGSVILKSTPGFEEKTMPDRIKIN